jgi:ubiquinone biosynthesis protein COQ4
MLFRAMVRNLHGIKDLEAVHNPFTNNLERLQMVASKTYYGLFYPKDASHIARLGEASSYYTLKEIQRRMLADPVGRQILQDKPRIRSDTVSPDWLKSLPDHTFGKSYIVYMERNDYKADERPISEKIGDLELAYIYQRYKEVHDILHSIFNLTSSVYDELVLKWYEFHQTELLSCGLGSTLGPLILSWEQKKKLFLVDGPMILERSRRSKFFMNVYFEKHFEQDYQEFLRYFFQEEK